MQRTRFRVSLTLSLVLGLILGSLVAIEQREGGEGRFRAELTLPDDLAARADGGSIAFGEDRDVLQGDRIEVATWEDRVGLLEVQDPQGRVIAARILPQSQDWRLMETTVDLRSTAAAIVLTTPGIGSADPYLDALLLAGMETSPLLDQAATILEEAARADPDWHDRRWELLEDLTLPLLEDALDAMVADLTSSPDDVQALAGLTPGMPLAAEGVSAQRWDEVVDDDDGLRPAPRPSCDGAAMGDVDGLEHDGVCLFPASPMVMEDDPDAVQTFIADNRSSRWVTVFAGEQLTPIALIPPRRWALPQARVLLGILADAGWSSDWADGPKHALERIGIEYLREDATFWQQLQLRVTPYQQAPLVSFSVPAGLLSDGLATATFGLPRAGGIDDTRLMVGAGAATLLTLITEMIAPTMAIALNLQRDHDAAELRAAEESGQAPVDSCLAGMDPRNPSIGGTLVDHPGTPADERMSDEERNCRAIRALRMSLFDQLLEFALDNESMLAETQADLSSAALSTSLTEVAEASIASVQVIAATGFTDSSLLTTVLTVDLFSEDVGAALVEDLSDAVLDEFREATRSIVTDALSFAVGEGPEPISIDDASNPLRVISAVIQQELARRLGEILAQHVATQLASQLIREAVSAIAVITRVERIADGAIDTANIFLTANALIRDVRDLGTFDAYAPVMLDAAGQPTTSNAPDLPSIRWSVDTGTRPHDTTMLVRSAGHVHVWNPTLDDPGYGYQATVSDDGQLGPPVDATIEGETITVTVAGQTHRVTTGELLALAGHTDAPTFEDQVHAPQRQPGHLHEPTGLVTFGLKEAGGAFGGFLGGTPDGLAVAIDASDGSVVLSRWVEDLSGVSPRRDGQVRIARRPGGNVVTITDPASGAEVQYGPDSTGSMYAPRHQDGFTIFGIRGGDAVSVLGAGDANRRWGTRTGTDCAEVDGSDAATDPERTCRRVDRWFETAGYLVGAYIQGGFEVRSAATGQRLLVDAAEHGAAITAVTYAAPNLFIGDGHGGVRIIDLDQTRGNHTGRLSATAIDLGQGQELIPVDAIAAAGSDLYLASNVSRRLLRYAPAPNGDWTQRWLLATDEIATMTADPTGAYVLRTDGNLMAVR